MTDRAPPKFRPMTQKERESTITRNTSGIVVWLFGMFCSALASLKYDDWAITGLCILSGVMGCILGRERLGLHFNLTEDNPTEDA